MQIRLMSAIRHRSAEYQAGEMPDLPEAEAHSLIAAGLAEAVAEAPPSVTTPVTHTTNTTKRSK